jgi:hypothetical protein
MKAKKYEERTRHNATQMREKYALSGLQAPQLTDSLRQVRLKQAGDMLRKHQQEAHRKRTRSQQQCSWPHPASLRNGIPLWGWIEWSCYRLREQLIRYNSVAIAMLALAAIACAAVVAGIDTGLHQTLSWRLALTGLNYAARFLAEIGPWVSVAAIMLALLRNLRPQGYLPG